MRRRPEGWDNPFNRGGRFECSLNTTEAFELGADTMLEALKERGQFILGAQTGSDDAVLRFPIRNEKGWVIQIPEEG